MSAEWNKIMDELNKKRGEWDLLRKKLEDSLENAPEGMVYIRQNKGKYPQYYYTDTNSETEQYLKKQEGDRIRALIQKRYDQTCLSAVTNNLNCLNRFIEQIHPEKIEDACSSMSETQKKWVRPVIVPDDIFVQNWLTEMEEKKERNKSEYPLTGEIVTEKGEWVRSKSEKIIADKMWKKGIPYVYEVPLNLKGFGTIYPDFAILDLKNRQTVWFEHFGKMDDPEYCRKALNKIRMYGANGCWFGEGLLYTFETSDSPLHTVYLDEMIDRYL